MSNRYVWDRYDLQAVTTDTKSGKISLGSDNRATLITLNEADTFWSWNKVFTNEWELQGGPLYVRYGSSYQDSSGKFAISNSTLVTIANGTLTTHYEDTNFRGIDLCNISSDTYGTNGTVYFGFSKTNANAFDSLYSVTIKKSESGYYNVQVRLDPKSSTSGTSTVSNLHGRSPLDVNYSSARYAMGKGTANGTSSNASQSTYPQDGVSGNYWYELQGSDTIDAASVTYSNQAPMGGQPIIISVAPSTGNVYGGTIRYTYQVQLSGGSWTTIATDSTATSQQYTIPAGTTSFAARVLASDTWGFSSADYTTGTTLTVTNNLPPTAPASITIGDVLGGESCTITWEAATDSDGTIASYQLERQTDNGDVWTQIYSGLALTYDDTINSEWATVNYRVRAVDDDGDAGPYATGTMKTVNDGWLYFSGPAANMGDKPAPFDFVFAVGSTTEGITAINVQVVLDDVSIYTGTPDAAEQVTIPVDTRLMYEGEHVFVITAEKENLLGLTQACTFTVPAITLPDGGAMVQLYNDDGRAVFPLTLGRAVIGQNSESVNRQLDRYFSGTDTGTATQLRLSFTPRFLSIYSNAATPATGLWIRTADADTQAQGVMQTTGGTATVQWDAENMILSWYGSSATVQLNASGVEYGYVVTG